MLKLLRSSMFLVVSFFLALPSLAQITSSQVWNGNQIYNGSVSPAVNISSANPTYTVYFKPVTLASQDYYVALQTSPDGVNWSTITDKTIFVSRHSGLGGTYQMTVDVKTVRARLYVYPNNLSFSFAANAWIVN